MSPKVHVSFVLTDLPPVVNEELPSSPLRTFIVDQLKTSEVPEGGVEKTTEADKRVDVTAEVEKVVSSKVVDGAGDPRTPETVAHEEEKTAEENPASTFFPSAF
ncbi:hypothetical protein Hanom_Chr02g00164901 [Helianthus anomalus]